MKFKIYDMCAVCNKEDECKLVQYLTGDGCKDEKLDELLAEHGAVLHLPVTKCDEFELMCGETYYYNDDLCHVADIELYDDTFYGGSERTEAYVHKENIGEIYIPYPWEEEIGGEVPTDDREEFYDRIDEYKDAFINNLLRLFATEFNIDTDKLNYWEDKEGWGLAIESKDLYWRLIEKAEEGKWILEYRKEGNHEEA